MADLTYIDALLMRLREELKGTTPYAMHANRLLDAINYGRRAGWAFQDGNTKLMGEELSRMCGKVRELNMYKKELSDLESAVIEEGLRRFPKILSKYKLPQQLIEYALVQCLGEGAKKDSVYSNK